MEITENQGSTILNFPKKLAAAENPAPIQAMQPAIAPQRAPEVYYSRREPIPPATPFEVRDQIFNTVRFVSYDRVNEVGTIEELIAILEAAVSAENERFPDAVRLKAHSITELANSLAQWSWKYKRKPREPRVEIPDCNANDLADIALMEIRMLAPHGRAYPLLQLFRKNHMGQPFLIQPEKMARACYAGTTWTIKNYKEARDVLLREGFIAIHEQAPGRAVKYVLASCPLTDADRRKNTAALEFIVQQKG